MLGVALLGCGRIAVRHAQLLSSSEIAGAKIGRASCRERV